MANKFGDNVKKIRTDKNISQQELADVIGIHSTHVSRYERNMAQPSVEIAKKMGAELDRWPLRLNPGSTSLQIFSAVQSHDMISV